MSPQFLGDGTLFAVVFGFLGHSRVSNKQEESTKQGAELVGVSSTTVVVTAVSGLSCVYMQ